MRRPLQGDGALSLLLSELVAVTGDDADLLRRVLAEEVVLGRVRLARDGGYAIVTTSFPPAVLRAVAALSTPRPDADDRPTVLTVDVAELAIAEDVA